MRQQGSEPHAGRQAKLRLPGNEFLESGTNGRDSGSGASSVSNYAAIKKTDIANGTGVRVSVFLSGCPHHCQGCFNREAWDYDYGKPVTWTTLQEVQEALDKPWIDGLTMLGGEPMAPENLQATMLMVSMAKGMDKTVWIYSGYTWEELTKDGDRGRHRMDILRKCDVLVDGRFVQSLADKRLVFRGSSNQRIINVPASIRTGSVVVMENFKTGGNTE